MIKFEKIKANASSLAKRKLVKGVGVNDSWYITHRVINGKNIACPIYLKWKLMIARCYSTGSQKQRAYDDCSVCKEWLVFSVFAEWCEDNYIAGCALDKDLKNKGNKVYSPENCLFVPRCINNLLTNTNKKSKHPLGVSFMEKGKKYRADLSIDGVNVYLGLFSTQESAHKKYTQAKNKEIKRKCKQHPSLAMHLIKHLIPEAIV